MKKILALSLGLVMLSGCASGGTNANQPVRTEQTTAQTAGETTASVTDTAEETTTAQNVQSNGEISLDDAKAAALADAGVTEDSATFVKAKKERDDGRNIYDIEFYADNTKYEYEINAADGSVISSERDANVNNGAAQSDAGLDAEAAKAAALAEAGLTEDAVTFVRTSLDYDDGRRIYDIEFVSNDVEYSFEISADDGSIIEYSQESVYD